MYYVYKHTRLDTNQIFYIGIGTKVNKPTYQGMYYRAYSKVKSRNNYWKNIIKKTKYKIEIIFESNCRQTIENKEIELIAFYKNTLCNMTSGGEGIKSYKHTDITKEKIRNSLKGRKRPKEVNYKINKAKCIPIIMYNNIMELKFNSIKECCIYLKKPQLHSNIANCLKGKRQTCNGYKYKK